MQIIFHSKKYNILLTLFLSVVVVSILTACGDGGYSTGAVGASSATASVASIQISGLPTTVKSDGSTTSTVSVTAVDAKNSTVSGATINLTTDTGLLSASIATTDSTGKATVVFSSGAANKANRTATITATAGSATALLPIQIVGSTLTMVATTQSIAVGGASPATLTITAKDAGGIAISGDTITLTQTGTGTVTLTPITGTTDANGKFAVTVAGATAGTVSVSASGVGATTSTNFTVASNTATFGISQLTLNAGTAVVPASPKTAAMQLGDSLVVQVTAPTPTTQVAFGTTIGYWNGTVGQTFITIPCVNSCTATLNTGAAGVGNVQVVDPSNSSLTDTLTVGMTAKTAAKILLQATPTVVPKSVGSTVGYSNLIATVSDATGAPVGNAPVAFSIVKGGTNSGETISPVIVFSATTTTNGLALGVAPTTFTSGSLSSGGNGVEIRASVIGTTISTQPIGTTNNTASSLDAAIVVGGTAGSIAFGQAAKIVDLGGTSTIYTFPLSVLVADSNGSPAPLGTVVNISTWPIAWTTGSRGFGCDPDPDGKVWDPNVVVSAGPPAVYGAYVAGNGGTFYNEDINSNLVLDAGEDGTRTFFATGTTTSASAYTLTAPGSKDNTITPANSYGGTLASTNTKDLPGTATTDASGVATFNLTYTKSSAYWIISRIRASAMVQGSPAVGQLDFRLVASQADAGTVCYLPPSPFKY